MVYVRHGLSANGYVLYVGVLEPRKNVPMLIEAFGTVARQHPAVQLAIAGQRACRMPCASPSSS
jgi:glycosyltransferase involved in cell wall biosynthesis